MRKRMARRSNRPFPGSPSLPYPCAKVQAPMPFTSRWLRSQIANYSAYDFRYEDLMYILICALHYGTTGDMNGV